MSTTRDVLLRAAELVERGWTQHAFARDAQGRALWPGLPGAVCWCPDGALYSAKQELGSNLDTAAAADRLMRQALLRRGITASLPFWNDQPRRTAAQVASLLREAAEVAP